MKNGIKLIEIIGICLVSFLFVSCNAVESKKLLATDIEQLNEVSLESIKSPEEVVALYVKASSNNKLAEISNLITETPDSYWKERTEELIKEEKSNITVSQNYSQRSFNRHIFEKVSKEFPDFLRRRNLYIESVTKVLTNGNKSRVILVLNSKTDDNFKYTTMTSRNFYLFKVDNSWKIFEIMDGGDVTDFPY